MRRITCYCRSSLAVCLLLPALGIAAQTFDSNSAKQTASDNPKLLINQLATEWKASTISVCQFVICRNGALVYDATSATLISKITVPRSDSITGCAISTDGKVVATIHELSGGVWLWDAKAGKKKSILLPGKDFALLALSQDGSKVAAVEKDSPDRPGRLYVIDRQTGKVTPVGDGDAVPKGEHFINKLQFVNDGRQLAGMSSGVGFMRWSVATARRIDTLSFSQSVPIPLTYVRANSSGTLALGHATNLTELWDLEHTRAIVTFGTEETPPLKWPRHARSRRTARSAPTNSSASPVSKPKPTILTCCAA